MLPMSRILNEVMDSSCTPADFHWGPTASARVPRTNIFEGEKDYRVQMDLPGVRQKDLEINLESDVLTVKAERNYEAPEGYKAHRCEASRTVTFQRSFTLGSAVDADKITAEFADGVLTVAVPKSDKSLPRRIEIK